MAGRGQGERSSVAGRWLGGAARWLVEGKGEQLGGW